MKKLCFALTALAVMAGCEQQTDTTPTFEVTLKEFSLVVPAKGEIESGEAKVISAPGRSPMTIAWLEDEYTQVKKGQLVAEFDGEQLSLDLRKEQLAMMLIDQDMQQRFSNKSRDEKDVASEKQLVVKEFAFADEFAIDDIRLYSKLEIIDKMQNKEYLKAKDEFLDWKQDSVIDQNASALEVLDIRKKGHQAKYSHHKKSLDLLQVTAPYDGLLVYQANWRGEKPSVGATVFPGNPIAKIPNLNKMQAKLYVLDKEAMGLKQGQAVEITLDAYPETTFNGSVSQVAGFSRTISRGNPTKYFEVIVEISDKANEKLKPGRKLTASIKVDSGKQKLLIPMQAIYNEDGENYVYKKQGGGFAKQVVQTGKKSLYFVEVLEGLSEGDLISLADREQS